MKRKIISLLLCLVMALSLIPTVAFGVDAGVTPTNVDIPVEKVWSGDENHSDQRPQSITVRLLDANNEPVGEPIILEANKSWKGTLTVPSEGTFTIQEVNVPEGYTSTVTQQPIVGNITLGTWSQKHTPASQPNLSLDGYNMFVAKKGDELYIWCAFELTGSQRIQLINHLKEVAPSELKPVKEDKTTTTTTGAGCGFSISNNSVTFDNPNDWSLVYLNNISFNVTNAKITNTYKENVPTTGNLTITKDFKGLPKDTRPESVTFTVAGINYRGTVALSADNQWSTTLEGLATGDYTVTEDAASAQVNGYNLTTSYKVGDATTNTGNVNVTENGATVTVTNTYTQIFGDPVYNLATLTIKKVDADNPNLTLSGAKFTLTNEDGQLVGEEKVTGEDGICTFTDLIAGTYTLTETEAPGGYEKPSTPWTVTVTEDEDTQEDKDDAGNIVGYKKVTTCIVSMDGADKDNDGVYIIPNTELPEPYTVEIPVTKNVTISRGSKVPVAIPFTFKAYVGDQEVGELKLTPTKNGGWTATGDLEVSIPYNRFEDRVATVTIKEIPGGDTRWKYDTKVYTVTVRMVIERAVAEDPLVIMLGNDKVESVSFENIYSYKYTPTPRPTTPTTVTSVKTGDMGVALYAGLAILSMTGSAGVILRRRKNDK